MKRTLALLLSLTSVLLVSPPSGISANKENAYIIGRDDILDISVWQSPDLTTSVIVGSDGTIDYPILGPLPAAGLTPTDLEKNITQKLAQGFVKNPQVNVAIKEYNSKKILVFGEVAKPGLYKLRGATPVLELLFMVGGAKPDAKRMTVIRPNKLEGDADPSALMVEGGEKFQKDASAAIDVNLIALLSQGDLVQNIFIQPGDTIYVASGTGLRYHVLGQVKEPGPYEWIQDITVLEAIKLAGGATERGALNRIKVRKNHEGNREDIKVNVLEIMKGKRKDDIMVKPGDTIIVPESWI